MDSQSFQSPSSVRPINIRTKRVKVSMKLKEIENYQKLSQQGPTPGDCDAKPNNTIESNQSALSAYLVTNMKIKENSKRSLSRQKNILLKPGNFTKSRPKSHIDFTHK